MPLLDVDDDRGPLLDRRQRAANRRCVRDLADHRPPLRRFLFLVRLDVAAQHGVAPRLVAGALGLELGDHVPVEPDGQLLLGLGDADLGGAPVELPCVILDDGGLQLLLGHGAHPLRIDQTRA